MSDSVQVCPKCGNDTFKVVEDGDFYGYTNVLLICTKCKKEEGIIELRYGGIQTTLNCKEIKK